MKLPPEIQGFFQSTPMIGDSEAMRELKIAAAGIARGQANVLIVGETGTGRETLARYIHNRSSRKDHPFIPVDCTSLPDDLLERELFGYGAFAFPGATRRSLGCVRAAHNGVLFLEEFDDLLPRIQSKLLEVLCDKVVQPLGDEQKHPANIRVICSTTRSYDSLIKLPSFNGRLLSHLTQAVLRLSPLREREGDVVPLANHFLSRQAKLFGERPKTITPETEDCLDSYSWPNNVRELFEVIDQARAVASDAAVTFEDLPPRLNSHS